MFKNQKGSALLTVMLMMLIFTILGISILSVTIGGAKRTEGRESQIETDLDAIKAVNEGIAYIKNTINSQYNSSKSLDDYNNTIIPSINSNMKEGVKYEIENVTERDYSDPEGELGYIDPDQDFTRVFDVSALSYSGKNYTQRLYVTAMPSFLKYALGSKEQLTMNGSIYIEKGNIYSRENLYISDQARYIFDSQKLVQTDPSSTDKNSILEAYKDIYSCTKLRPSVKQGDNIQLGSGDSCYNQVEDDNEMDNGRKELSWKKVENKNNQEEINKLFETGLGPTYLLPNEEFVDVYIPETIIDKLSEINVKASYDKVNNNIIFGQLGLVNQIKDDDDENEYVDTSMAVKDRNNYIKTTSDDKWIFIEPNQPNNLFEIKKGNWLIINGNAFIENIGSKKLNIDANIIVTGNLRITGDVAFNSTIYVLGNVEVIDANISGYKYKNDKGDEISGDLILMNENKLSIAKINKFIPPQNPDYKLNVYFYTASEAELYAVGSYITITGGLFAGDNLEVNSFRGTTDSDLKFDASDDYKDSRLVIYNDRKLFLNQSQGLPRVDKLQYITDPIKKE